MTDPKASFLPFELGYFTKEIKAKAEKELEETDEIRQEAIIQIRKLLKEESKLFCSDHDSYLLTYLRASKFNVKKAFELLKNSYDIKKSYPDVYGQSDFECLRKSIIDKILNVMPYRDEEGCVILIIQLRNWDTSELKFKMFVHNLTCAVLACVDDPATQVCGIKVIFDVIGVRLSTARHVHPKYVTVIARGLRNGLPVRVRAVHILNEAPLFYYFWNFVSIVLTEKIRNRIFFHNSNKSLQKHFNPLLLPEEYCGELQYDNSFWLKKIESMQDIYEERVTYGYRS